MRSKLSLTIVGRKIGLGQPPYIIAELSENHNDKLETAIKIIEEAKAAGADAVKLQTYRYPAPAEDYNLNTIPDMIERFGLVTGLSDHTVDNTTAITNVALGAALIEKHFTLYRNGGGPDDSFSLEPAELETLCREARTAWNALGAVDYDRKASEKGNAQFRRSQYFVKPLKAGEVITEDSIRSVHPGYGLPPKGYYRVLGKVMKQDVFANTPVKDDLF